MRKQTLILSAFIVLALGTVLGIWLSVRMHLQPVTFPPVLNAELIVGPQRKHRQLTFSELQIVQKWIRDNQEGWGPLHENPPSTGDAEIRINQHIDLAAYADKPKNERPYPLSLTLWLGIHEADWNNRVFYEIPKGNVSQIFLKHCSDEEFQPLRLLVDQYDYDLSEDP